MTDPTQRVNISGIPAALLVMAAAFLSRERAHPSWPERGLARLGDASYSIYLAQVETMTLVGTAVAHLIPWIPPLLLLAVTTAVVTAFGWLLNIAVERPLLKFSRRLGAARRAPVPANSAH